jgi:hypothetical protein
MATATERIPVLVTPREKSDIARMAKAAGLSMGEFLRRAAAAFRPDDDERLIVPMIEQMVRTTAKASAAIDDALAYVDASNRRIARLEAKRKAA